VFKEELLSDKQKESLEKVVETRTKTSPIDIEVVTYHETEDTNFEGEAFGYVVNVDGEPVLDSRGEGWGRYGYLDAEGLVKGLLLYHPTSTTRRRRVADSEGYYTSYGGI